ncbi:MAG: hypothetical protein ACE5I2_00445 [Anaerolineae bacterium]
MTIAEFEHQVFLVAIASPICGIPIIRRLMPTSINLRVPMTVGGFVDAFYNEETDTTAYALIQGGRRVFGADNTGGWHIHPFDDPVYHQALPGEMSFAEFVAEIERHY